MPHRTQSQFISAMGAALHRAGLPPLPARVFSALLVDDDATMTAAELGEALGVSAAGVSGAVKYLTAVQMIRRDREPGSRRDRYVVDEDAWHDAMTRTAETYAPMLAALEQAIAEVGPGAPQRSRLVLTREFLLFVDREMTALGRRWERHKRRIEGA